MPDRIWLLQMDGTQWSVRVGVAIVMTGTWREARARAVAIRVAFGVDVWIEDGGGTRPLPDVDALGEIDN